MNEKEVQKAKSNYFHVGMVSTYLMLVDNLPFEDVVFLQNKYKKLCSFYLAPCDVEEGYVSDVEVGEMIDYFVEQEDYKKCAKLKKIKL